MNSVSDEEKMRIELEKHESHVLSNEENDNIAKNEGKYLKRDNNAEKLEIEKNFDTDEDEFMKLEDIDHFTDENDVDFIEKVEYSDEELEFFEETNMDINGKEDNNVKNELKINDKIVSAEKELMKLEDIDHSTDGNNVALDEKVEYSDEELIFFEEKDMDTNGKEDIHVMNELKITDKIDSVEDELMKLERKDHSTDENDVELNEKVEYSDEDIICIEKKDMDSNGKEDVKDELNIIESHAFTEEDKKIQSRNELIEKELEAKKDENFSFESKKQTKEVPGSAITLKKKGIFLAKNDINQLCEGFSTSVIFGKFF